MTSNADDSIDSESESILADNVGSTGLNREVPPASLYTFWGFVNDVNHEADFTDDSVVGSFAACNVVAALPRVPVVRETRHQRIWCADSRRGRSD